METLSSPELSVDGLSTSCTADSITDGSNGLLGSEDNIARLPPDIDGSDSLLKRCLAQCKKNWFLCESLTLTKLAFPLILSFLLQQIIFIISLIFVGHIPPSDNDEYNNTNSSLLIDSAALSFSTINITGISIGVGLSTAADTLSAQTFGYKNYEKVGVIFQRGLLILLLTSLFIFWIWLNAESILLLLQQPPCVARLCGRFMKLYCLALPVGFVQVIYCLSLFRVIISSECFLNICNLKISYGHL
jgi:hypothetical protein